MGLKGNSTFPKASGMEFHNQIGKVSWGYRMHRLHFWRGVRLSQRVSCYDTKQSEGEASVMMVLWGVQSIALLSLLPNSLRPGVVAHDRVLSIGQIELNCVLMLNQFAWNKTVLILKVRNYAKLNCLKLNSVLNNPKGVIHCKRKSKKKTKKKQPTNHHRMQFSVISRTFVGRVLPFCKDAVNVFYNPN